MGRSLKEIEEAVAALPPADLKKFRAWYEKFDAEAWDEQIERDIEAGKLDALADAAIADHRAGKSTKR